MPIPFELITMLGSTLLGGILKLLGIWMDSKRAREEFMLKSMGKVIEDRENARSVKSERFQFTRRLLAIMITFFVIAWPMIVPVFWPQVDISLGYIDHEHHGWWIFGGISEVTKWQVFGGSIVITTLHTNLMSAIAGLYFGGSIVGHR